MKNVKLLKAMAMLEILLFVLVVGFDIFLPTILIVGIGLVFLILRKEKLATIGFRKPTNPMKTIFSVLGLAALWSLIDYAVVLPILNHLTGTHQDVSAFADLKGNVQLLLSLLTVSWILAALGEELAYRGFVQNRIASLFPNQKVGIFLAVIISSALFGLAHTEQGIIGVVVTAIDAIAFSVIKYKYNNLWASVLMHGFMNSIGMITFYFTGPIYGLW